MKSTLSNILGEILGRMRFLKGSSDEPREPARLERPTDAVHISGPVIFEVAFDDCLYPYGMGYGPRGWHPFVETLKAYRLDRSLTYENSPLKRFYDQFQPGSMLELLYPEGIVRAHADSPLARFDTSSFQPFLPWDGGFVEAKGEKGLSPGHGHQGFGPVSQAKGEVEFRRLVRVYESIETNGYLPSSRGDGEIRGYFVADSERARFIVRVGQHRTSALAALGHERLRVGFVPNYPRAIDLCTVERWPLVRNGPYDVHLARELVRQYLHTDGTWVAAQAGLLGPGSVPTEGGPGARSG